jgi:kinesin family member 11
MQERTDALTLTLATLADEGSIREPLHQLRDEMSTAAMTEYSPTGETPAKTSFSYPTALPRTQDHDTLLDRMRSGSKSPNKRSSPSKPRSSPVKSGSPSKTSIYTDHGHTISLPLPPAASAPHARPHTTASPQPSLRELDVNVTVTGANFPSHASERFSKRDELAKRHGVEAEGGKMAPKLNRFHTSANPLSASQGPESKMPAMRKFAAGRMTIAEGRENVAPAAVSLSASVGPGTGGSGRVLRSRGSQD